MKSEMKWVAVLLLVSALWGSTFVAVKDTLSSFGPFALMAIRFSIAAAALFVYIRLARIKITKDELTSGSILGFFLFAGYSLQTVGLDYTSANTSAFITNLYVLLVPILSSVLLHKIPKRKIWLSVAISLAGLFLMMDAGNGFNIGDVLTIVSAFGWALQLIYLSKYSPKCNPVSLAFVQIAFAAIACVALMVPFNEVPASFPLPAVLVLVYLAMFATAGVQVLQAEAQRHVEPSKVALIFITEPLFAALFGFMFIGEVLSAQKILGASLILCALVISEWDAVEI